MSLLCVHTFTIGGADCLAVCQSAISLLCLLHRSTYPHPPAGLAMGLTFLQFGPQLLQLTGADPAVLAHAVTYLRIRALALPAVLCVQVRVRCACCGWVGLPA